MFFDIWAPDDYTGAALGELTEASEKQVRDVDQAIGSGQFVINRHSTEAAWCESRALVRVRRVDGGPFDFDDPRYVFAFFIEDSSDVALSPDEEGGENLTRGGRSIVSYLQRALIYPNENIGGHASYWADAATTGEVFFPDKTIGEVFRVLILNAQQRAGCLDDLTIDFTITNDSAGTPWPDVETEWKLPIGMNLLDVLSKLVAGQTYFRMTPGFLLSVYEDQPGDDLSGSITFAKAIDLTEAAEKRVESQGLMTRALVQGTRKDNRIIWSQAFTSPTSIALEAAYGRIEGFVQYQATATTSRLQKAGNQAVRRSALQSAGPTTAGVLESNGKVPWDDYVAGDIVTLNIPDVYDYADVRVNAIIGTEDEAGQDLIALEFDDTPFDQLSGPGGFGSSTSTGGGSGCTDCPEPPPFVPDVSGSSPVYAVLYGPNNRPDRAFYPRVGWYGDGDAPPTGYASAPKSGPVEYVDRTVNGLTQRWALRALADMTVDIHATATMAEVYRDGSWSSTFRLLVNGTVLDALVTPESYPGLAYFADSYDHTETGVSLHAGDVVSLEAFWSYGGVPVLVPAGTDGGELEIDGTAGATVAANRPLEGQMVGEEVVVVDADTTYATNYAYEPNSLHVFAGGARITVVQTDPTAGTFALADELPAGTRLFLWYQASSSTYLGTANNPTPGAVNGIIPYPILGTGGDGSGGHVLRDDGTWGDPSAVSDCCSDTDDTVDLATLRVEVPEVTYGTPTDQNLAVGTDTDGGGIKTFTSPSNAKDGNNATNATVGPFAAGVGNYEAYLKADLGTTFYVSSLVVWGDYECSTDPTLVQSIAPDGGWSIQYSDDGSSWTSPPYTATRLGTPGSNTHRVSFALTTPSIHRYWRVRYERYVLSGLAFMCGTDIHTFEVLGATPSGVTWVAGDDAADGDDATYEQDDLRDTDTDFLRANLGSAYQPGRSRLLIGFATSGARTLTLYGANESDFSDEVLLATESFTATGSYTADELAETFVLADEYRYYRWKDSADHNRRVYTWELYRAGLAEEHVHALDDLSDVDTTGGIDGDVLTLDSGVWTAVTPTVVASLDDLTDVTVTTPTVGDRLRYDGAVWINSTLTWEPLVDGGGTVLLDGSGNILRHEVAY